MTVEILIVEDDPNFIEEINEIIAISPHDISIHVVNDRDSAIRAIKERFFDLVILDLKLPPDSETFDTSPDHGYAVFTNLRHEAPGTPIFVLTGSSAEDFIHYITAHGEQIDIWSTGAKMGTIQFLAKYKFDQFPERLDSIVTAVQTLSEIELVRDGITLDPKEDRLLRIFTKKFSGVRCVVSRLGGGLSGAKVVRAVVTNNQGVQSVIAVGKLALVADVEDEATRYEQHINRLLPEVTPRYLAMLKYGGHNRAAIFYGLAGGYEEHGFNLLGSPPERTAEIILKLETALSPWNLGVPETRRSIGDIRRCVLDDEAASRIIQQYGLVWAEEFESRHIQTRWASCHGDLHGSNILISNNGEVALIDYGDVSEGPVVLDPITLELSTLFHPDAVNETADWVLHGSVEEWGNLDAYLENCPNPRFIESCREWAHRVSAGNREIAAVAYSYLLRQLKYEETNKDMTLSLIDAVRRYYESET